ncbi:MAG: ACT domain-containing protein [Hyphomicrobiales bacterium]|nr:ACT domain-containing protein [Hyphomicrobiales bacterium]
MDARLILTVIGPDRPGLVNAVSDVIAAHGGNWLDTRMASLAGQFAGILLIAAPQAQVDALIAGLKALEPRGLKIGVERGADATVAPGRTMSLDLVCLDRPGIVRDISRVLADRRVSIAELETERTVASFSGEPMFKARAELHLPPDLDPDELRQALEGIAHEMMADLAIASPAA